jgi:hypothetical protein
MPFPSEWKDNAELIRKFKEQVSDNGFDCAAINLFGGITNAVNDFWNYCASVPYPAPTVSGWYWALFAKYGEFEPVRFVKDEDGSEWIYTMMDGQMMASRVITWGESIRREGV